jgi:hypothetical protein
MVIVNKIEIRKKKVGPHPVFLGQIRIARPTSLYSFPLSLALCARSSNTGMRARAPAPCARYTHWPVGPALQSPNSRIAGSGVRIGIHLRRCSTGAWAPPGRSSSS